MPDADLYRLPRTVVPSRYELVLEPDLESATFSGDVAVAVTVREPVREVVLNAHEIEIAEAWFEPADGGNRRDATVTMEPATERVRLGLDGELDPGQWVLRSQFSGALNDKLTGFYRSTFTDDDGVEHKLAVTQFEATHARKAFPCWDEPELKAVFSTTLIVDRELTALSNSRELNRVELPDGRSRIHFADTIKMSTYLVAFVIGPLEVTAPVDVDNAPVRIAHPPGKRALTGFALESAEFALRYFADYYGIIYAGDKCDLVAVPDFAFGAMENLGCITFREVLLLIDPERATQPELQNVADVIHHELAHMWFGDLVTMKWWNGIWLNEAFATFMEMKCTDAFRPAWERWVNFGLARTAAFEIDALSTTRPVEFEVVSPEDAEGMFDILTYEKGAAVLRMLEQYLGEDRFRDGIRQYLATHQFGNTETTDLWDAIETATGEPVREIMDSWIFQGGFPVVDVELVRPGTVQLRQQRFRYEPDDADVRWSIPVLLSYGAGTERVDSRVLLRDARTEVVLDFEPEWVQVNVGGSGFYRVRYSAPLLATLAKRSASLDPLDRYGLLDDAFSMVLAGTTSAPAFMEFARSFGDDRDLAVWQRLSAAFGVLERVVEPDALPRFQAAVRGMAGPALVRMGWTPAEDEDARTRQLRATLFDLMGTIGADDDVRARARALYQDAADGSAVDASLLAAAISVMAESGGREEFDEFLARFRKAENPQEQIRYLYSLAKFHDDECFAEMLELSLSEVRTQNAPFLLSLAMRNRVQGPVAWNFVRRHWSDAVERFPSNTIVRMAEGVRWLTDDAVANDVQAFFAEHEVPQGALTIAQHLERLRVNLALRHRESAALSASL